ncbi:hypothetical protein D0U02_17385 [Burkholderia pseudomallei]|nr:hypothetical protein EGY15_04960 [Burkholderia pseudomallei]PJO60852.1 hypothetical protein CWD85_04740 [Burkholderia pseudomallei]RFS58708.1 hypothetical protein D0U05_09010 [Burkholderia pseudomallei]RFS60719.1 hypothetical protein D0U02_17385 [Burkholderia pseudomallei]RFS65117.1 hypothetical protein D0U01_16430 [Burkholderia pseudomallei]
MSACRQADGAVRGERRRTGRSDSLSGSPARYRVIFQTLNPCYRMKYAKTLENACSND